MATTTVSDKWLSRKNVYLSFDWTPLKTDEVVQPLQSFKTCVACLLRRCLSAPSICGRLTITLDQEWKQKQMPHKRIVHICIQYPSRLLISNARPPSPQPLHLLLSLSSGSSWHLWLAHRIVSAILTLLLRFFSWSTFHHMHSLFRTFRFLSFSPIVYGRGLCAAFSYLFFANANILMCK